MRVLIIDDDEDIRRIVSFSLERVGNMEVLVSDNAQDGLRLVESEKPDVVVLDVMMPQLDGPAMLAQLRANPAIAKIPVIFLTGNAMTRETQRLRALGAAAVITKPFDAMQLPDLIRSIVDGQSLT